MRSTRCARANAPDSLGMAGDSFDFKTVVTADAEAAEFSVRVETEALSLEFDWDSLVLVPEKVCSCALSSAITSVLFL